MSTPRNVLSKSFRHLHAGERYVVVKEFQDYDGQLHPVGEAWRFDGSSFLPYEDGLSLMVEIDGVERQIRLQQRPEQQGPIIDELELEHYVVKLA